MNVPKPVVARAEDREREGFGDPSRGAASWFTFFSRDRTPTNAMTAGLMELPPHGGALRPHRHAQAEVYFVQNGEGEVTIDGTKYPISEGSAVFIPGDAEHSVRNDSEAVLRIFYIFATDSFDDIVYRFVG